MRKVCNIEFHLASVEIELNNYIVMNLLEFFQTNNLATASILLRCHIDRTILVNHHGMPKTFLRPFYLITCLQYTMPLL